jgi:hypothetical protein
MPIVAGKPNASHFFLSFFLSKCLILELPIKQAIITMEQNKFRGYGALPLYKKEGFMCV